MKRRARRRRRRRLHTASVNAEAVAYTTCLFVMDAVDHLTVVFDAV